MADTIGVMPAQAWSLAMDRALYGPNGFYRRERPADHFRTSVHASTLLADVVLALATRLAAEIGEPFCVVDVGAGAGELLAALSAAAPAAWELSAVELRPRPEGLPARVQWRSECEYGVRGLVVAHELLDNIPVDVVARHDGAWVEVWVDESGVESLGPDAGGELVGWLDEWWPEPVDGDRVEVGRRRETFWQGLSHRLSAGELLAVDYALDPIRHRHGTLVGYRDGRVVEPVPNGDCDLTAHVRFDALRAAGEAAGLTTVELAPQHAVLAQLGVSARRPPLALASSEPARYLRELSRAGQAAELLDPTGLGAFQWLRQRRAVTAATG